MSTTLARMKPTSSTKHINTSAEAVLAKAQSGRAVIQDFVPLADSLEWNLGQQYLRERGNKAFLSDARPVPFVINNDGTLSRNAAQVFFASCLAADKAGTLEADIYVLELGIGVGLFARYFLDAFRDLCVEHDKDYYGRLCYIAGDHSKQMLLDAARHGVFANHPGHYLLREVDALDPAKYLRADLGLGGEQPRSVRAVFLNYVIDCLPPAVLEVDGDTVKQLCVRTCIARNIKLEKHTDLTLAMLVERAKSAAQADGTRSVPATARQELLEVYGLFASEYDYREVDPTKLPHGEFAVEYARKSVKRVLHNYGAIQSLERLLGLLHAEGFILINDYGQTKKSDVQDFEHQRFSLTTAMGLNFPLLRAFFEKSGTYRWVEPLEETESIHARLLGRQPAMETIVGFVECFGKAERDRIEEPLKKARECQKVGRFELAADLYRKAVQLQPSNWMLLCEVAHFLIYALRDIKAGLDMVKVGLRINPTCSSELWTALANGLHEFGRYEEAEQAYLRALQLNAKDRRAKEGLAGVLAQKGDYGGALKMIAEAFVLANPGENFDELLRKQNQILVKLARQMQMDYLLLANLISRHVSDATQPTMSGAAARQREESSGSSITALESRAT